MGRGSEIEVLSRDPVQDAEDDELRDKGVALVSMEKTNTEGCYGPGDEGDDDNTDDDGE